jgi:transposase
MNAPLAVCTKEEQRSVIRFLWSEGVSGAEIHRRLTEQYGNSVLSQRTVYEWIERFKNGPQLLRMRKEQGHQYPPPMTKTLNTHAT